MIAVPQDRGRREDRVRAAPAVSCAAFALTKTHTSIQVQRRTSGLPCAMVLTAYSVLSPATNSSCHRHRRIKSFVGPGWANITSADLTPATGARTTRLCRTQLRRSSCARRSLTDKPPCDSLPRRRCRVHRIPRPTFVTMANAPLRGHEMAQNTPVICLGRKHKYFSPRGWTEEQISSGCFGNQALRAPATRFGRSSARQSEVECIGPVSCG
jgi:hypothetical protein